MSDPIMCRLLRDGKLVYEGDYIACMQWIHKHHCYSLAHALAWEGYALEEMGPCLTTR